MIPGIGPMEMLLIAILAIIVIGPKDLPLLMRRIGAFLRKARAAAADFQASLDEIGRQSEIDALRKEMQALKANASFANPPPDLAAAQRDIDDAMNAPPAPDPAMSEPAQTSIERGGAS